MTKPKVCITTIEFPPDVGGVGESVHRIAQMLIKSGYEVHVAVFRSKQRFASDGSCRRARCKTTQQGDVFVHRIRSAVRQPEPEIQDFFGDVYFYLKRLHQQYRFDLFHAFFLNETGYVTTLLSKEHGLPVINSIRGSDLHKNIFSPKFHAQTAWTLDNSDWTTFVSQDLLRRGAAISPSVLLKSSVFLNSIAPIEFDHLTPPALVSQLSGIVIGSSGRFRDKKGIEFLLDACAELSTEIELTLLLIGDFVEKEKSYWEQEIQQSKLVDGSETSGRLRITGIVSREEALAYLPHLDIYAIPSLHDGCPNALLEAMLAGCAIVGTNVDAIGEILADGTAGLVVEPGDSQQLAAAIRQLAVQPELRQRLGAGARQKVLQQLSPNIEQANWLQTYQRVLQPEQIPQFNGMSVV
ncbi:glycosyltransferase [Leptothermofonsia sichuanensis E412]|uniref:glycosyltransferase n=1 Tax=Leptothermofonsia sichuanensis TaxID=2917832 RepID=UPI001CA665B8|nr:glycosyltransferase [Leptothermofonsia sichuanensis]QZZ19691.1 glycosyltransferase [Leptothermofonsia sichuanensis E412]